MTKKSLLNEKDKALFRQMMRNVKPLNQKKSTANSAGGMQYHSEKISLTEETFSDFESMPEVTGDDLIEFAKPGIQHKVLRNLRNGKYNVEATLDLHGMTVVEARDELSHFLAQCTQRRLKHVLIIHGKGHYHQKPILKNKINNWLRQVDQVVAFCSATVHQGRSGAVYVLLRNPEKKVE